VGLQSSEHWPPFLLQIAGGSGAGKSTLACLIGKRTGAVVIDLDAIKPAALDAGSPWDLAGRIGYGVSCAVAGSLLGQRKSVILDSPCRFQQIVDRGSAIAEQHGVPDAGRCMSSRCVKLPDQTPSTTRHSPVRNSAPIQPVNGR
jgi:predicted kinase